jgi:hypothetical protein
LTEYGFAVLTLWMFYTVIDHLVVLWS